MSGALAAALGAACCCRRDRDGGGGGRDPECPQAGIPFGETADASIGSVSVSFSMTCIARALNVAQPAGPCWITPEETYEEVVTASVSGGQATLDFSSGSAAWTGCGTGGASVIPPLQHGRKNRDCGNQCFCLGYPPGCSNIPCCGSGPYAAVRLHSCGLLNYLDYLRLGDPFWVPNPVEYAEIQIYPGPDCCGCDPEVPVGVPVSGWVARVGMSIARVCRLWPGETTEPCYCPGSDVLTFDGYSLAVGVRVFSTRWMQQNPNSCGSAFLGSPLGSGWRVWKALYSKPCCSGNDTVRGTYTICHPTTNSGSLSGTCNSTYEVIRSSTATVS